MSRAPILLLFLLTISHCSGLTLYKAVFRPTCNHKVETVKANSKFAFDMFQELDNGNSVYSPISVSGAMAMVHEGAIGITFSQLYSGLKWSTMPSACIVKKGFKEIIASLLDPNLLYTVSYANRVFTGTQYPLTLPFSSVTTNYYSSPATTLPFLTNPAGSEAVMNNFIASNTNPSITNMFSSTSSATAMVIANAVTFIGKWVYQFDATTVNGPFTNADGSSSSNLIMSYSCPKNLNHAYLPGLNAEVVQLPYQGDNHDMFVFLPYNTAQFASLKANLNYYSFTAALNSMVTKKVFVRLPKFTHETDYDLTSKLQNLGVSKAFSPLAEFDNLSTNPTNLYLDQVAHRATVNVNEVGTEATAATTATFCPARRRRGTIITFNANRPFVYVIRQRESLTLEFMGSFEKAQGRVIIKDVKKEAYKQMSRG